MAYVGFVVVFSLLNLQYMQSVSSSMNEFSSDIIGGHRSQSSVPLDRVISISSFYDYLANTLYPSLYFAQVGGLESTETGYPAVDELKSVRLFGDILIYTDRVSQDADCGVGAPFKSVFGHCFASDTIHGATRDKSAYGTNEHYKWTSQTLMMPPVVGSGNEHQYSLSGGGFLEFLSTNYTLARTAIDAMVTNNFLEPDSNRVVVILISLINPNLKSYAMTQVKFEITASGEWVNSVYTETLPIWLSTPFEPTTFTVLFVIVVLYLMYFIVLELLIIFIAVDKTRCVKDNWASYIVILLLLAEVVLIITTGIPSVVSVGTGNVFNGWQVLRWSQAIKGVMAVNAVLVYSQIFGFFVKFNPRIPIFFVGFLIFAAVSFRIVLGRHSPLFTTYENALVFLALSLVGSSPWSTPDACHMGSALTVAFFIVCQLGFVPCLSASVAYAVGADGSIFSRIQRRVESNAQWFVSRVSTRLNETYEKHSVDLRIKRLMPGLYYKVIRPNRQFEKRVQDLAAQARSSLGSTGRSVLASDRTDGSSAEPLSPEALFENNIQSVKLATGDLTDRLNDVGSEVENESRLLASRIVELNKVLKSLALKIHN